MWRRGAHISNVLLCLACVWSWSLLPAQAQERGISVRHSGPDLRAVSPDTVVTLVFRVPSTGDSPIHLKPVVTLPPGWRLVLPVPAFDLAPGGDALQFLSVAVPAGVRAGPYHVGYGVTEAEGLPLAADSVRIEVRARRLVTVHALDAPSYVPAGDVYRATFLVSNEGNVPERIDLSVRDHQDEPARLDAERFTLEPFASRRVMLTLETSPTLTWKHTRTGTLIADVDGAPSSHVAYAVDVIPRFAERADPYRRLPTELSATSIGQGDAFYPQIQLRAAGSDIFRDADRLELIARGPNRLRASSLGEIDEYAATYRAGDFAAHLGDGTYALTPLTEPGIRAFGGRAENTFGRWTLGAYAAQTRYYAPAQEQLGGFVRYAPLKHASVGASYLANHGLDDGHLFSVLGEAELPAHTRLSAELGADAAHTRDNLAAGFSLEGETSRLSYSGRYMNVGNQFAGSYRGTAFWSASGRLQLPHRLALEGSFFNQSRRALNDLTLASPRRYVLYRAGARYAGRIGLFYVYGSQNENEVLGRTDQGMQLDLRFPFQPVSFFSRFQTGRRSSRTLPGSHPYYTYDVSAYLHLGHPPSGIGTALGSLFLSIGGDRNTNAISGDPQRRFSVNAGGSAAITERLKAEFILSHSHYRYPADFDFTSGDLQATYQFPFGHRLVVRARWFGFGQPGTGEEQAFSIRYVVPLNLPIGRSQASGNVQGRIYDARSGTGMAGVLVNLGDAAVLTGPDGTFAFRGLAPEEYAFGIDGVDVAQVAARPVPAEVEIAGGQTVSLDVGLTPSASLEGRVVRYGDPESVPMQGTQADRLPEGGQAGVLIEVRSGAETQRRLTDSRGAFSFQNLRPGTWTISIAGGQVPDAYHPARDSLTLALEPGDAHVIELKLIPVRRTVQIVSGGVLSLDAPPAQPGPEKAVQAPIPQEASVHVVSPGDVSLFEISRQAYGSDSLWVKIWLANQEAIPNPDLLPVGTRLVIPPAAPLTDAEKAARRAYYQRKAPGRDESVTPERPISAPVNHPRLRMDAFKTCALCRYLNRSFCNTEQTCRADGP